MRNIDFTPFRHSTVGFDRLFDLLESSIPGQWGDSYPAFDLAQEGEDRYRITLAVPGFGRDEIEVTAQQNALVVKGRKSEETKSGFIHRGIASQSFERRFGLADHVRVTNAELKDGMLSIALEREIPEESKPRKIQIGGGGTRRLESTPTDRQAQSKQKEVETA